MLTLKSSHHLRTGRHLKSFRAAETATGIRRARAEWRRLHLEEVALARRQWRRRWLAQAWAEHRGWCRRLWRGTPWVMP